LQGLQGVWVSCLKEKKPALPRLALAGRAGPENVFSGITEIIIPLVVGFWDSIVLTLWNNKVPKL
jgi:hypothetical protein